MQADIKQIKRIAEQAPFGIQLYDAQGYCVFVNDRFRLIFGAAPPESYCVLKDELVAAAGNLHLVHQAFGGQPAQLPLMWYDPQKISQLPPEGLEYVHTLGKKCAIETYMNPWLGEDGRVQFVLFIYKDVTAEMLIRQERERAIKERDDAKTLIRAVLEQTRAVVYIKNLDFQYVFVNGQYCRIFGLTEEEIIGHTDFDLFPRHIAAEFHQNDVKALKSDSHIETEEIAIHADQSAHTYLSLKFPLKDSAGNLYAVCGVSTDVTQRRRIERELSAAKRMETVGILAGGIAHDFNNSLEIVLLVADTMLMTGADQDPKLRAAIDSIKTSVQGAAVLTRQLLTFARKQSFMTKTLQPDRVIRDTLGILSNALGSDIHFDLNVEVELWPVRMDPSQLEQLLTNLCFNARDAMPKGGLLKICLRNRSFPGGSEEWRIGTPSGQYVEIALADTGTGMDVATLDRIFEPFFSTKPEGQGSGLGLSTVYGIVQQSGGDIAVESAVGKGTTFKVLFPRSEGRVPKETAADSSDRPLATSGETVLLVDDQPQLLSVTATLLRECGYKVFEASTPEAALATYSGLQDQIDVVVTDVVMPGQTGLEMAEKMAASGKKPKVLFVSAYAPTKFGAEFEPPHRPFLAKPFTANQLLREIRGLLDAET